MLLAAFGKMGAWCEVKLDERHATCIACAKAGDEPQQGIYLVIVIQDSTFTAEEPGRCVCLKCIASGMIGYAIEQMKARGETPPTIAVMIGNAPIAMPQADGGLPS